MFLFKKILSLMEALRTIKRRDNLLCLFNAMFLCPIVILNNDTFGYTMKVMTS